MCAHGSINVQVSTPMKYNRGRMIVSSKSPFNVFEAVMCFMAECMRSRSLSPDVFIEAADAVCPVDFV